MKTKIFTIDIEVLKAKVIVILRNTKLKKKHCPFDSFHIFEDNDYFARCAFKKDTESNDGFPFKCIIHSKSRAISVIAHEAVHAATYIMQGMGFESEDDELRAYIVQYICEKIELELNNGLDK